MYMLGKGEAGRLGSRPLLRSSLQDDLPLVPARHCAASSYHSSAKRSVRPPGLVSASPLAAPLRAVRRSGLSKRSMADVERMWLARDPARYPARVGDVTEAPMAPA